jgi:hypothetical protein
MVRFLGSAGISLALVIGGATLLLRPASATPGPTAAPVALIDEAGTELDLGLVPGDPVPVEPLPVDSTIQLASFVEAAAPTQEPDGTPKAAWWSGTVPRVPAVTQFDGGKLAGHNCVMAGGAMLAGSPRHVTTGSQLPPGRTTSRPVLLRQPQPVLKRGWGVTGRGAEPSSSGSVRRCGRDRVGQPRRDRSGPAPGELHRWPHIYIDASATGPDGPAAYYVMDHRRMGGEKGGGRPRTSGAIARYGRWPPPAPAGGVALFRTCPRRTRASGGASAPPSRP